MSKPRMIVIDGVEIRASDVCRRHGVSRQLYSIRLKSGWDSVEAAVTPPGRRQPIDAPAAPPRPHGVYARVHRGWDRKAAETAPVSASGGWNRGMTLSPAVARVVADVEAGETIASVARKHGVDYNYVWQACSRRGVAAKSERRRRNEAAGTAEDPHAMRRPGESFQTNREKIP